MYEEISTFPIQVSVVPGETRTASVPQGATVAQAIEACGFDAEGYQVRSAGREVSLTSQVSPGASITLTRQVKGN